MATLLERLPLATTHFVAISKSGGTGETLMQTTAALAAMKARRACGAHPGPVPGHHGAAAQQGGKRSGLRVLFDEHHVPMLEHDPGVGGRYSVLTNVGLLPAAVARPRHHGDPRRRRAAALAPVLASRPPAEVPAAVGAALAVALGASKPMSVMLAYADRLERFTRWYVQLWAESLGKDGKGTTPIAALGPVDQHSQLQLYHRRPARQAVHDRHRRRRRPRPAHRG